jgi:preprotein translocase subunit SecF
VLNIIRPDTSFDFMKAAPFFAKISAAVFAASVALIAIVGVNLGLDFSGGHEVLLQFEDPEVEIEDVRRRLNDIFPGVDTSVQSFEVPTATAGASHYLTRIMRSETFGDEELETLQSAFESNYGELLERPIAYNPEAGDVVKVDFVETATRSGVNAQGLADLVETTGHPVRLVREVGRPDQQRYEVVLKGVDVSVVNGMRDLDPGVKALRVEFVGPTVGKQLRDDGILAVLYALGLVLIYIALRFDIFYGPGAIVCLFHDAIITVALLTVLGAQFSLATIAGLLTLVGYSINDTIVIFDRIRERVGKAQGSALDERINVAINETLGRTIMTSISTLIACFCLMVFGRGTVLAEFGLIMTIGILIGTYSSIYVASPTFRFLRTRFGEE